LRRAPPSLEKRSNCKMRHCGAVLLIKVLSETPPPQQGHSQSATGVAAPSSRRRASSRSSGASGKPGGKATVQVEVRSLPLLMYPHPPLRCLHSIRHVLSDCTIRTRSRQPEKACKHSKRSLLPKLRELGSEPRQSRPQSPRLHHLRAPPTNQADSLEKSLLLRAASWGLSYRTDGSDRRHALQEGREEASIAEVGNATGRK
jgi:hypothetical protein